jgi:hypothetical protein
MRRYDFASSKERKSSDSFFVIKLKLAVLTKVNVKPVNINRIMKLEAINEKIIYKTP